MHFYRTSLSFLRRKACRIWLFALSNIIKWVGNWWCTMNKRVLSTTPWVLLRWINSYKSKTYLMKLLNWNSQFFQKRCGVKNVLVDNSQVVVFEVSEKKSTLKNVTVKGLLFSEEKFPRSNGILLTKVPLVTRRKKYRLADKWANYPTDP